MVIVNSFGTVCGHSYPNCGNCAYYSRRFCVRDVAHDDDATKKLVLDARLKVMRSFLNPSAHSHTNADFVEVRGQGIDQGILVLTKLMGG